MKSPTLFLLALLALTSCSTPPLEPTVGRKVRSFDDWGSTKEKTMAALMRGHPSQKREKLIYSPRLAKVARARARDLGQRAYFGHVDPDGIGPNHHITRTGYRLPLKFTAFKTQNQVESIIGGPRHENVETAFQRLLASRSHRPHMLGTGPFYQDQTRFGIGHAYVPGSPLEHYWSIITAPPSRPKKP